MITVYPMLVSNAVNENALPGICKMVENYLISYSMDAILNDVGQQARVNFKIKRGKIFMNEISPTLPGTKTRGQISKMSKGDQYEYWMSHPEEAKLSNDPIAKQAARDYELRQTGAGVATDYLRGKGKPTTKWEEEEAEKERKAQQKQKWKDASGQIDSATRGGIQRIKKRREAAKEKMKKARRTRAVTGKPVMNALSLEPTMVPITLPDGAAAYLGVKAVPIRVKSDSTLAYMILSDLKMKWVPAFFIGWGRRAMRWVYKKLIKYDTPTGDIRKDMLMARTGTRGDAFVIIDKNEDLDIDLMSSPKLIKKLFSLSWGNLIITDDVTKQASFCMKKFKGMCSTMSYSMMYQQLGQSQTYADLEDARKKSGSLFKMSSRITKVIGEHISQLKKLDYFLRED